MSLFAVVPILPSLATLLGVIVLIVTSGLTAIAAWFRPETAKLAVRFLWTQKLAVLLLTAVGVVCGVAIHKWSFGAPQGPLRPTGLGSDWPTSRGSLLRTGHADGRVSPMTGDPIWRSGRTNEPFYASPAVSGDRVFCIGSRGDQGLIYCWDAADGGRRWTVAPSEYRATFSSPVVFDRYLICGEGLHHAALARVVCIDLAPQNEGSVLWTFTTNGHVECTPCIANGRVYVAAGDDGVYCLRLDPGVSTGERLVWHRQGSEYPDAETSLAVHNGRVYVGLGKGGKAICVLDAESGNELNRVEVPYPVFSPPAIDAGKLFVGMGEGDYVRPLEEPIGQVCCFDLATMRLDWSIETRGTVLGAIAIAGDDLYCGSADGQLYAVSRSGQLLRTWNSHSPILAAPAVTDEAVYVINQAGMLYCLDRKTFSPLWESRLGTDGYFISSPVIAHGHLYVGTGDGFVCIGRPTDNGRPSGMADRAPGTQVDVAPSFARDALFVARSGDHWLVQQQATSMAYVTANGEQIWLRDVPGRCEQVAISNSIMVAVFREPAVLIAMDRLTGISLWSSPLTNAPTGPLEIERSRISVPTARGLEYHSMLDGALLGEHLDPVATSGDEGG